MSTIELYVRDGSGRYKRADPDTICAAAASVGIPKPGEKLDSSGASRRLAQSLAAGLEHEVFTVVFLDNRHRVINHEAMFRGTINRSSVYAREVVKAALAQNAAAVIFMHNHPSGDALPSESDVDLTEQLSDALSLVDVRVLDHIIVGGAESVSLAEIGKI